MNDSPDTAQSSCSTSWFPTKHMLEVRAWTQAHAQAHAVHLTQLIVNTVNVKEVHVWPRECKLRHRHKHNVIKAIATWEGTSASTTSNLIKACVVPSSLLWHPHHCFASPHHLHSFYKWSSGCLEIASGLCAPLWDLHLGCVLPLYLHLPLHLQLYVSAMPAPPARQKTTHASIEIGQQTNPMQCQNTYVEQIQITLHLEYDECDHQTQYHDNMMSIWLSASLWWKQT